MDLVCCVFFGRAPMICAWVWVWLLFRFGFGSPVEGASGEESFRKTGNRVRFGWEPTFRDEFQLENWLSVTDSVSSSGSGRSIIVSREPIKNLGGRPSSMQETMKLMIQRLIAFNRGRWERIVFDCSRYETVMSQRAPATASSSTRAVIKPTSWCFRFDFVLFLSSSLLFRYRFRQSSSPSSSSVVIFDFVKGLIKALNF